MRNNWISTMNGPTSFSDPEYPKYWNRYLAKDTEWLASAKAAGDAQGVKLAQKSLREDKAALAEYAAWQARQAQAAATLYASAGSEASPAMVDILA